tara:strand:- start:1219 stop:1812 length:594 start_codon:yes stop_codon:yes gene_type:complete
MEILQESDNSIYLKFISRDKQFKLGDQECKFKYMQLDLDTLQTGWGRYEGGYEFVWDTVVGAKTERPAGEGWTRAFSIWVMVDGVEDRPLLWQRNSVNEYQTMLEILRGCALQWQQQKPLLPCFALTGTETIKGKMNDFNRANFSFVDWKPRKASFVIPTIDAPNDDDWISPNVGLSDKVDEQVAKSGDITEDDLPF